MQDIRAWLATACRGVQVLDLSSMPVLAVQAASIRRTQQQMTQHPYACWPWRAGFTGADLQNLMNEAAILAARRNLKEISKEEISDALERIVAGPEKKGAVMTEQKKRLVAYHEVWLLDRPLLLLHARRRLWQQHWGLGFS